MYLSGNRIKIMPKVAEIIIFDTEEAYLQEFRERYLKGSFVLKSVPVSFVVEDFQHVFFEPSSGGVKDAVFSKRRAKKMRFIEVMLAESVATEVMFEQETGNLAVFCDDLDCVMCLRIRKGSGKLQLATFFDFGKDHTKMCAKQKKKCVPITDAQIKEIL